MLVCTLSKQGRGEEKFSFQRAPTMPPKCSFNAAGRSQATAVRSYGHLAGESSSCFTSLNPEHTGLTIFGGSGRSEFSVSSSSPAEPMGAARGGYGSLSSAAAVNAAVVRDCGCSSSISVAENTPQRGVNRVLVRPAAVFSARRRTPGSTARPADPSLSRHSITATIWNSARSKQITNDRNLRAQPLALGR